MIDVFRISFLFCFVELDFDSHWLSYLIFQTMSSWELFFYTLLVPSVAWVRRFLNRRKLFKFFRNFSRYRTTRTLVHAFETVSLKYRVFMSLNIECVTRYNGTVLNIPNKHLSSFIRVREALSCNGSNLLKPTKDDFQQDNDIPRLPIAPWHKFSPS